ncbi:glycolate oxidase subunit GlcF [Acidocella sp.]|uniref:glycolate oxidase subunit GlcF n=1 Tax=Acidocella sp. TaxID=50710 RepID=UPI003CFF9225
MQTDFTPAQLADPHMAASEAVIRKCVHCGFCTATCPTYVLLGDELDSPRGRIYLIKDMLENERVPGPDVVSHVDRCLSCLSCMTTCPSGVNYMHLVDHARAYIERRYRRPLVERALRAAVAAILPVPGRLRAGLRLARLAQPLAPLLDQVKPLRPAAAMLRLAPPALPPKAGLATANARGPRGRVVVMQGCAEPVLRPEIRAATVRLLERCGYQVSFAAGEACCGALTHHMGKEASALQSARGNVDAWTREIEAGLEAIVITASGCGTTVKDYGFMLRDDPAYAAKAAKVSALAKDISEVLEEAGLPARVEVPALTVGYHPPCSIQHGQKITAAPQNLLRAAGFSVRLPADAHLCCGSAGTYNIFQPEIAGQLGTRKAETLAQLRPDVVATGNIGCAVQIGQHMELPVVHLVELLDWATGGPAPAPLAKAAIG